MRVSEEIPYQLLTRSMSVCVYIYIYIYLYIYIYMNKLCFLSILKNVAKQVQSFWVVEATYLYHMGMLNFIVLTSKGYSPFRVLLGCNLPLMVGWPVLLFNN
jgi:hypothetical protein